MLLTDTKLVIQMGQNQFLLKVQQNSAEITFVNSESNILFDAFKTFIVATLVSSGLYIFILVWGKKLKGFSYSLICPGSKLKIIFFFFRSNSDNFNI